MLLLDVEPPAHILLSCAAERLVLRGVRKQMRPPVDEQDQDVQTGTHFLRPRTGLVLHYKLPVFVWILNENALNLAVVRQTDMTGCSRGDGCSCVQTQDGHHPQVSCESIAILRLSLFQHQWCSMRQKRDGYIFCVR